MFQLPELGYGYNALEPHIDAATMEIHHGKHHAAYIAKLNDAIKDVGALNTLSIVELLAGIDKLPENIREVVRNNGGGHYNHSLFWESIMPGGTSQPSGELASKIDSAFGGFENFKTKMNDVALNCFGSGWGWLVKNGDSLEVYATGRQDSPIMEGKTVLLGADVWEHAYYLKYQNRRADYLQAWWNVVNWDVVALRNA